MLKGGAACRGWKPLRHYLGAVCLWLGGSFFLPEGGEDVARPEKEAAVAELKDKLSRARSVVLTDYRGLTVAEITELRKRLREAGLRIPSSEKHPYPPSRPGKGGCKRWIHT
jgi:hypothetical protein